MHIIGLTFSENKGKVDKTAKPEAPLTDKKADKPKKPEEK